MEDFHKPLPFLVFLIIVAMCLGLFVAFLYTNLESAGFDLVRGKDYYHIARFDYRNDTHVGEKPSAYFSTMHKEGQCVQVFSSTYPEREDDYDRCIIDRPLTLSFWVYFEGDPGTKPVLHCWIGEKKNFFWCRD